MKIHHEQPIRVLLIEDSPTDVVLLRAVLARVPEMQIALTHVEQLAEGLDGLAADPFDVVVLDLGLPDSQGLETFYTLQARIPIIPIVLLSTLTDERLAAQAVHQGAQDYLPKGEVEGRMLARVIRYTIERKRTEQALLRYAERLELLHTIDQAILAATTPQTIAAVALRPLQTLVSCWQADLVLFDVTTRQGTVLAVVGPGDTMFPPCTLVPLDAIEQEDLEDLRAIRVHVVEDVLTLSTPPPAVQTVQAIGLRSYARVPLISHNELLDALNLGFDRPGALTPELVDIVCEVADLLAVALQQARLREQVERHTIELEVRVAERTAQLETANQALQREIAERAAAMQQLETFSYTVAHDLHAPLRGIVGYARILLDEHMPHLDADAQHYLQWIAHNAQQLGQLMDGLLAFSRLSCQPLQTRPVSPADLVRAVWDSLRAEWETRQVELVIGDLPPCQAGRHSSDRSSTTCSPTHSNLPGDGRLPASRSTLRRTAPRGRVCMWCVIMASALICSMPTSFSASSGGCTPPRSMRAPGLGWRSCNGFFSAMAGAFGRRGGDHGATFSFTLGTRGPV